MMRLQPVLNNLLQRKTPQEFIEDGTNSGLKKTLNVFDLIVLGIGAVVGTGIFTIIGSAIAGTSEGAGAGSAIVISMILAAIASVFSALSYSEIAAMIPVAGSAYTYTYATMGEFMAWMVGWILMLEYAIGNITVACAWTGYFVQFLKGFKHILPAFVVNFPMWLRNDYRYMFAFCDKYGLTISVEYQETTAYEEGKIIDQSRAAGSPIVSGQTLTVTVARTPQQQTQQPSGGSSSGGSNSSSSEDDSNEDTNSETE